MRLGVTSNPCAASTSYARATPVLTSSNWHFNSVKPRLLSTSRGKAHHKMEWTLNTTIPWRSIMKNQAIYVLFFFSNPHFRCVGANTLNRSAFKRQNNGHHGILAIICEVHDVSMRFSYFFGPFTEPCLIFHRCSFTHSLTFFFPPYLPTG